MLQPWDDPQRENRRSIGLGTVNVHVDQKAKGKDKSEEILRMQGTRMIDVDDDDEKAWEEPNLVATFDVGYLVSCKKRDEEVYAQTKRFFSIKLKPT